MFVLKKIEKYFNARLSCKASFLSARRAVPQSVFRKLNGRTENYLVVSHLFGSRDKLPSEAAWGGVCVCVPARARAGGGVVLIVSHFLLGYPPLFQPHYPLETDRGGGCAF